MAQEDFNGHYQVVISAGTEFGIDTEVEIRETDGQTTVAFVLPIQGKTDPPAVGEYEARYDESLDCLRVGLDGERVMCISRYPELGADYHAIYSIVTEPRVQGQVRRLPIWAAKRLDSPPSAGEPGSSPIGFSDFVGDYVVASTVNTQFGAGSKARIDENGQLTIWNALGMQIVELRLKLDPTTISVHGNHSTTVEGPDGPVTLEITVVASLADEAGIKYLHGNFTIDDPEQAGTFGGEEDNPGNVVDG